MFWTWTGKGYMVPLAAAGTTLGFWGLTSLLNITVQDEVISTVAAFTSSFLIWKLHFWIRKNGASVTILVDEETGETDELKLKHDFCMFPIWFWGLAFGLYGVYLTMNLVDPKLVAQIF